MQTPFTRTERTFSAAEVAEFFGVPEATQRDWRRRDQKGDFAKEGFETFFRKAEKGKRFQFTLNEACALALAKVQVDAGKGVGGALWVGKWLAFPAKRCIELAQSPVSFPDLDLEPGEKLDLIRRLLEIGEGDNYARYLFFPTKNELFTPYLSDPDQRSGSTAYEFASLSEMEEKVTPDWVHGQLFSLEAFAFSLAAKTRGVPLIVYRQIEQEAIK